MSQITGGSSSLPEQTPHTSLARRAVALVVLIVAAWLVLTFVIHVVMAIATGVLVVVAIAAAIWAARVLF